MYSWCSCSTGASYVHRKKSCREQEGTDIELNGIAEDMNSVLSK